MTGLRQSGWSDVLDRSAKSGGVKSGPVDALDVTGTPRLSQRSHLHQTSDSSGRAPPIFQDPNFSTVPRSNLQPHTV